ncbi:LysR family transcriptional regulator [Comamonas testosteroni]|uniref:LysR family transcriptional regulator n=1 Tax=Comamonas testosteroni TaxID=285 RepID=A0A373FSJ9_COMTE|nr:LysR family transcriptional regulator [Comamonas testosteroni]RGE47108.1 LysR family transcriptional regulator [Comamonas testosteroni]
MNYRAADLNLLKVFEALMTERNVTRAADKLSLTQPTVSNALRRLRETFDDPLFVRSGSGVRPTPKATDLWKPLSNALQGIRAAMEGDSFDAANSQAELSIAMTDYTSRIVTPALLAQVSALAPAMKVHTRPGAVAHFCRMLADESADFAIGTYNDDIHRPAYLRSRRLWSVDFPCFMRAGHPLAGPGKISLKKFLNARHLDVSLTGETAALYDRILDSRGLRRNLVSVVGHYTTAYEAVRASDLIAVLPWSQSLESAHPPGLVLITPPLPAPARTVELFWHERYETSAQHQWMRELIISLFAKHQLGSTDRP